MKLAFAECGPERLHALRAFFGRVYSPNYPLACDERLLRWQFRGPMNTAPHYHVKLALAGDEIQASLGYIPVEMTVAGQTVRAAWTANWMVDPACRRLGLGPLLLRDLMAEFDAVLAVGLDREASQLLPRMGWVDFGELTRYVAVIDPQAPALLTDDGTLQWPVVRHPRGYGCAESVAGDRHGANEAATVWARECAAHCAGTSRSAAFLEWRYVEHPSLAYRFVRTRDAAGRPAAMAIYRAEPVRGLPVTVGRIVELIAGVEHVDALLEAVYADARSCGVAVLDFFCATKRFTAALLQAGYCTTDMVPASSIPVVFQPIDRRRSGIRFMAHFRSGLPAAPVDAWYVTKGDGDQDRPN